MRKVLLLFLLLFMLFLCSACAIDINPTPDSKEPLDNQGTINPKPDREEPIEGPGSLDHNLFKDGYR